MDVHCILSRACLVSCVALVAPLAGGCAAVPVATLGTLLGVGASAVSAGNDVFQLGKLDTAEMAAFDRAVAAARRAADDLSMRHRNTDPRRGRAVRLTFEDARGAALSVRVEPRTATLVRIRIDVGWFGSETTARLFLERMRVHLPRRPEEPPTKEATEECEACVPPAPTTVAPPSPGSNGGAAAKTPAVVKQVSRVNLRAPP
jgi:hypothetical protein